MHRHFDHPAAPKLKFPHHFHTDHPAIADELNVGEQGAAEETEVAVHIPDFKAKQQSHQMLINATKRDPVSGVRTADLIAIHQVHSFVEGRQQSGQFADVVLPVPVSVEDEILGAIGLAQLRKLPSFLERRRKNAQFLNERCGMLGKVVPPKEPAGRKHSWYVYTLRLRGANAGKRNKVIEKMRSKNIEAAVYYESPLHLLPLYREQATSRRALPETEKACRQVFSLPVHPRLDEDDLSYIFETLKRVLT